MTTGIFWVALLLGTALVFGMIYGAVRLALIHDRALQARAPAKGAVSTKATSARWALLAEEERARMARDQEAARAAAEPRTP